MKNKYDEILVVKIIIFSIIAIMYLWLLIYNLCGCANSQPDSAVERSNSFYGYTNQFKVIEEDDECSVVYDLDTKVMYVVSHGFYSRGVFTVLLNEDGSPKLYSEIAK